MATHEASQLVHSARFPRGSGRCVNRAWRQRGGSARSCTGGEGNSALHLKLKLGLSTVLVEVVGKCLACRVLCGGSVSQFWAAVRVLVSVSAGKPHFGSSRTIYSAGVRVCLEFLFGGCSSKQSPSARGDGRESGSSDKIVATGELQRQTRGHVTKDM